jgi:acyl-CoA dehydrogenase
VQHSYRAALASPGDQPGELLFHEIRAFRIYDGPTEVPKWSLAKKVKRDWIKSQ